jgi:hypothetical protein
MAAINEVFGWLWILIGFATGAMLGARFSDEHWLGGYASYRRRLVRLGHISFIGLGALNILFAHSIERARLDAVWMDIAAWSFIVGGVTMPLCCALTAWRPQLKPLFAVPVTSLLLGGGLAVIGMMRS